MMNALRVLLMNTRGRGAIFSRQNHHTFTTFLRLRDFLFCTKSKHMKNHFARLQLQSFFSSVSSSDITKLTSRDEENIVHVINTFSKAQLSETRILPPSLLEELCTHRTTHGPFLSLGDVLALPGMENEVFRKICNSFKCQSENVHQMMYDPAYLKYFTPSLIPEYMEEIETVTSIEVCLDSVCFASATRNEEKLTGWKHVPLLGSNHSKQSPAEILEQALHVLPHIPRADIYLAETRISRKNSLQYMPIHLFVARLQTAIQTLLSVQNLEENEKHSFYFVKDLFVARMFDLSVGGERVSGQHAVQQIEDGQLFNQFVIGESFWRQFHRLRSGVEKERYANCLMTSLAFINYIGPRHSGNAA